MSKHLFDNLSDCVTYSVNKFKEALICLNGGKTEGYILLNIY